MPFAAATPSTPGLDGAVMRQRKSNNQGRRRASLGMLLLMMMMDDDGGGDDDNDNDILNQSAKEETSTSAAHPHKQKRVWFFDCIPPWGTVDFSSSTQLCDLVIVSLKCRFPSK
jgi:hypothetical protein